MRGILCLVLAVMCLGCAKLVSTKVNESSKNEGFVYSLKKVGFQGNVTYVLSSCGRSPEVEVVVDIEPKYMDDKTTEYVINYDKLMKINKNIDLSVSYGENGGMSGINMAAEDRTIELTGKVVGTAGKIALTALKSAGSQCTEDTSGAVKQLSRLKSNIKNMTSTVSDLEKTIAIKMQEVAGYSSDTNDYRNARNTIDKLQDAIKYNNGLIAKDKKSLAALGDQLSMVLQVTLGYEDQQTEKCWKPNNVNAKNWFNPGSEGLADLFSVCARLENLSPKRFSPFLEQIEGVYYRQPALGLLTVCHPGYCRAGNPLEGEQLLFTKYLDIPQFGTLAVLPFHNNVGGNNQLGVAFSPQGGLQAARFTNKAADEKLGTLMDQVAQTVGSVISGAKTQGVDRTKAQTDLLKAQVDRLKAQKELQDAQSALNKGGD